MKFTDPTGLNAIGIEGGIFAPLIQLSKMTFDMFQEIGKQLTPIVSKMVDDITEGLGMHNVESLDEDGSDSDDSKKDKELSLDNPESLEGASPSDVEDLIPDTWEEKPMKKGNGKRFLNPEKKGESILLEDGWENSSSDNVHSGPYAKISRNGKVLRIPLEGNPVLENK